MTRRKNGLVQNVLSYFLLFQSFKFHWLVTNVEAFVSTRKSVIRSTITTTSERHGLFGRVSLQVGIGTTATGGVKEDAQTLDWSFLDGVYVIHCPNGDPDGTRMKSTREVLANVNLLVDVNLQVKEFDTDDDNRIRGCYTSHLSVYRDILKGITSSSNTQRRSNGFDFFTRSFQRNSDSNPNVNVLILEDNVALAGGRIKQEAIESIDRFVKNENNVEWDVLHLSYIPYVPDLKVSRTDESRIVKVSTGGVGSALGTTAYIINRRAMERLVAEDDTNGFTVPIPDAMANLFGETRYASYPTIFVRAPRTKSLVNPQLDDLRSILFQPTVTLLAQQLLVTTGLSTNALLPLVVLALLGAGGVSVATTIDSCLQLLHTGTLDGPWIIPLGSVMFSIFSLGLIVQGALLAPKPDDNKTR